MASSDGRKVAVLCVHWIWDNCMANMTQCLLLGSVRRRLWEVWLCSDGHLMCLPGAWQFSSFESLECCKISGIVSNSVAASLGSHSPWHKTTEPLSWAPSWQHRDAPSWTQCALTKTLYARPSAQTLLLDGSTGLTDRAITRENRSSPKVKVTSIDTLASSLYVGLIIIYTTTDPCWPRWWPRAWWSCQHVSIERREETESVIKHHLWPDILINTPSLIFI